MTDLRHRKTTRLAAQVNAHHALGYRFQANALSRCWPTAAIVALSIRQPYAEPILRGIKKIAIPRHEDHRRAVLYLRQPQMRANHGFFFLFRITNRMSKRGSPMPMSMATIAPVDMARNVLAVI
jgi:hypothetical protein